MLMPTEWLISFFWVLLPSEDPQREEEDMSRQEEEPAEGAHQPTTDQNHGQQNWRRMLQRTLCG
jgi:hypothetical protein